MALPDRHVHHHRPLRDVAAPSSSPDTSSVLCASKRSATRGRNCGGIRFAGFRFSCSSVGSEYCQGCTTGGTGTGGKLVPSSAGRPCTTSGSSGVPRPVARLAPGPPPRPPPPTVALTVQQSPLLLYIARLSGTPYTIGLVSSTTFVRNSDPTTRVELPARTELTP